MLHFLRHIRRSFFLPGKVRTYLAYAFGEIVLIVVGILIALEANEWKEERRDRIEEKQVLNRISEELSLIILDISWMLELPRNRKIILDRIAESFAGKPIENNLNFLEDVANGAAWDQPSLIRSTFDETHTSGKLGLIQNIELRNRITRFYNDIDQWQKRATLRGSDFAKLAFELVPTVDGGKGNFKRTVREGLSEQELDRLTELVLESDLRRLITPTVNRQDFLVSMWTTLQNDARDLLSEIQAELGNN
jgi:hypothetical protein